ncbi:MAG: hypothetical protein SVW02_00025 [Candidatus Nanohaloarchaea archaeon]|nr:hypothetical protein [Candidatus Nanohaloarchaea archaeon]
MPEKDELDAPADLPFDDRDLREDILDIVAAREPPVATSTILTALWEGKNYRESAGGSGRRSEALHHAFRTRLYEVLDRMNRRDVLEPVERPSEEPIPEVAWRQPGNGQKSL